METLGISSPLGMPWIIMNGWTGRSSGNSSSGRRSVRNPCQSRDGGKMCVPGYDRRIRTGGRWRRFIDYALIIIRNFDSASTHMKPRECGKKNHSTAGSGSGGLSCSSRACRNMSRAISRNILCKIFLDRGPEGIEVFEMIREKAVRDTIINCSVTMDHDIPERFHPPDLPGHLCRNNRMSL
jgi:hypothetical protein